MNYFKLFYQSLRAEKIEPSQNKLVPQQFYAKNYADFYSQIQSYAQANRISKFIVLTDGKAKKSSTTDEKDITEFFSNDSNEKYKLINLATLCHVDPNDIHASEFYLQELMKMLPQEEDSCGYIALGSGTITDLLKHVLFLLHKNDHQFISIPTALTVTAFTSSFSVVDIAGAKRTRLSKNINATFWIEPLLKAAPSPLTRAGFGDLLARFVAYGDWYLGYSLGMFENYDEIALRLMEPFSNFLKCGNINDIHPEHYLLENIEMFAQTLAMAGVSMSVCGQTTPLSGYEHVISHGLDFLRLSSNKDLVLHGEQVALSTISSALTYEWLLGQETFDTRKLRSLSATEAKALIHKLLTNAPFITQSKQDISQVCEVFLNDYLEKNEKWNKSKEQFNEFLLQWPQIKKRLQKLVLASAEIEKIITLLSLPLFPEGTYPPTSALEYRWALRFAPFVRSRFCIADFIFWIGEDPCAVAAI